MNELNTKHLEEGEFILTDNGNMYYVTRVCKCDACKERGVLEPFIIQYKKDNLPYEEGYPQSCYWVKKLLPTIVKRTFDKTEDWVQEFLNDAMEQIEYYYKVTILEKMKNDIETFVNLNGVL